MNNKPSMKTLPTQEYRDNMQSRVAKLEVGMTRLADDMRDLAGIVRDQGSSMEAEMQKLLVAVTQASGPQKTDWSVIISAILLIMAIGSAVFWPLNQTQLNIKEEVIKISRQVEEHQKLEAHPVEGALRKTLEQRIEKLETERDKRPTK